ncbi:MAG: hydrogenase iron-sulfur subunit [Acidobacteria bacterium]|nr:hydrogenase iron-sulfur subunit [Acidobacteriota bacterium]
MNKQKEIETEAIPQDEDGRNATVSVFICANCARPGKAATSARRSRPMLPEFEWPVPVRQITVPCAGRIQPEHLLKAFESGADLVAVIACEGENCHYIEGSKRCSRRVEFVQSILEEIGLGQERLRMFFLPGSAAEDMLATAGKKEETKDPESLKHKIASILEQTAKALEILPPNPLRLMDAAEAPGKNSRAGTDTANDIGDQ